MPPRDFSEVGIRKPKAIAPASFDGNDVRLIDPWGRVVSGVAVTPVAGSENTRFALPARNRSS